MPYIVVFTLVKFVWLRALNASAVKVKALRSVSRKLFSRRRSTLAVRGIWKALGGRFGSRLVPPAPSTPEEIGATQPGAGGLQTAPEASRAGAVPESSPV